MNDDFQEFCDIVGTETVPEYVLVSIKHPWGWYIREVICPNGERVLHEAKRNIGWVKELYAKAARKEIKLRKITREVSYKHALQMSERDEKMENIVKHSGKPRTVKTYKEAIRREIKKKNDKNRKH